MAGQWYYADGFAQVGPVTDDEMKELLRSGKINPDTMVKKEGMLNWAPLHEVVPRKAGPLAPNIPPIPGVKTTPAQTPPAKPPPQATTGAAPEETHQCTQCGQTLPVGEMIFFQERWMCQSCKYEFFQQQYGNKYKNLQSFSYGGFWIRFFARLIDGLIIGVLFWVFVLLLGAIGLNFLPKAEAITPEMANNPAALQAVLMAMLVPILLLSSVVQMGYFVVFHGVWGATPGKMLFGLRVTRPDGEPIGIFRAFFRYLADMFLSSLCCGIGYLIAAFDDEKRTLHDRLCDTRVMR